MKLKVDHRYFLIGGISVALLAYLFTVNIVYVFLYILLFVICALVFLYKNSNVGKGIWTVQLCNNSDTQQLTKRSNDENTADSLNFRTSSPVSCNNLPAPNFVSFISSPVSPVGAREMGTSQSAAVTRAEESSESRSNTAYNFHKHANRNSDGNFAFGTYKSTTSTDIANHKDKNGFSGGMLSNSASIVRNGEVDDAASTSVNGYHNGDQSELSLNGSLNHSDEENRHGSEQESGIGLSRSLNVQSLQRADGPLLARSPLPRVVKAHDR